MRVGALLLRLLVVLALLAGSVGAAGVLLGGKSSDGSGGEPSVALGDRGQSAVAEGAASGTAGGRERGGVPSGATGEPLLVAGAAASWRSLSAALPAEVGVAIAPLGGGESLTFGSLRSGHAWSTIKVPILVTLLRERGELNVEEEGWARAALTASDNEAAAALFGQLEEAHGGLDGASRAVETTLRRAGDTTTDVATAPPPSGAVSTYGQTEWSLRNGAGFTRELAGDCLLDHAGTEYVLNLMEEVVPEQRWGLGKAGFPPGLRVGMKGGWGPEGSAAGPYLVRQIGVLRRGDAGAAIAIVARANSGSFEAGVEALDRVAAWVAENLVHLDRADHRC